MRFVIEAQCQLVHEDYVLIVVDLKTSRASEVENGTSGLPFQIVVTVLAAYPTSLGEAQAKFSDLIVSAPERRPDGDGSQFATGVLGGIRLTSDTVVFLRQARVENSAKVDVAAGAAGSEYDAFARTDVQGLTFMSDLDSQNSSRRRLLPNEARHAVLQENLHASLAGRGFERANEPDAGGGSGRGRGIHWFAGLYLRPRHGRGVIFARSRISDPAASG